MADLETIKFELCCAGKLTRQVVDAHVALAPEHSAEIREFAAWMAFDSALPRHPEIDQFSAEADDLLRIFREVFGAPADG